jgi:hypothetical protein
MFVPKVQQPGAYLAELAETAPGAGKLPSMSKRKAPEPEDDWPEMLIVDEEDLVWDEKLGYHRCPLGLIQTSRPIVGCTECTEDGTGLKLYVQQLEREGICDVVVVEEDEHEVCLRAVTCAHDRLRAKYPRLIIMHHRWYELPPLNGRSLIDAETGTEVWVERFGDRPRADLYGPSSELDSAADTDLDIPF